MKNTKTAKKQPGSNIYELYYGSSDLRAAAKALRVNLEFIGRDEPLRSIAVTSAEADVGKSTVAICLGIAVAESGRRVLLVDNDFHDPQIAGRLRLRSTRSFSDLLAGRISLQDVCLPTRVNNLYALDMGNRKITNPVELMDSGRYRDLLRQLRAGFDFVIVDTPPLGQFIDAAVVAPQTDGVLLVIHSGNTTSENVQEALSQLQLADARVLGAVLKDVPRLPAREEYEPQSRLEKRERAADRLSAEKGKKA